MTTLSPRQQNVLDLARQGKRPSEIGPALGITPNNASMALTELRKLGIDVPSFRNGNGKVRRKSQVTPRPAPAVSRVEAGSFLDRLAAQVQGELDEIDGRIAGLQSERSHVAEVLAALRGGR